MKALKKYWFVVLLVVVVLFMFSQSNYSNRFLKKLIKEDKTKIKEANKRIDSLKLVLSTYQPNETYQAKIDSLKQELEYQKKINYEKVIYIYRSANFDSKYELLSNTISEGYIK